MFVQRMGYLSFGDQRPKVDQQHGQEGDPGAENSMLSANQTHQMSALFTATHYSIASLVHCVVVQTPPTLRRITYCLILSTSRRASDRKSTRLNSSHVRISYAVFCLKKK